MSLSAPFIRRPVGTLLLALGVMLLGWTGYRQLGVAALPDVDFPVIFISAALPGASPETMAASVATPLERQLGTTPGLNELTSLNNVGSSTIIAQFDLGRTADAAARDVQAAISAAAPSLPKDLPRLPVYFKANPNWPPVITLALTSRTLPASKVYDYAETVVAQKLSQLDGVAQVTVNGAEASAVRVQADPAALAAMGLSLEAVRQAIRAATVDGPKGSLDGPGLSWVVAANDQLHDAAGFRQVVIAWRNGAPVRLDDVAKVSDSIADDKVAGWWNDQPAVVVQVRKSAGANMVATSDRVRAALPQLARWLPPGIDLHVTADRALTIRVAIRDVERAMLLTGALVVMVIALFLRRFWATVIPSLTIPVALGGTFAVMYLCGYTLDNLSLMALILAIGFVVDDAIVMIEAITRQVERGTPPIEAALKGARQMAFTIVSITASLVSALIPLLFAPSIIGRFFREFSVILAAAIVISAVVSLTLTPMLCAHLLSRENLATGDGRWARRLAGWGEWLGAGYERSLDRALCHPRLMLGATVAITLATLWLYGVVPKAMMPVQDTGVIRGTTDAPPDISFAAMRERQLAVGRVLLADPAVADITSSIGGGGPLAGSMNNGNLTINLKPAGERRLSVSQVIDRLRPRLAAVPGVDTYLAPVQDFGFGARVGKALYQYTLSGPDLPALEHWVAVLRARMAALPELVDVTTDQDASGLEAALAIDRPSAARLGISSALIDQTLYDAFGQRQVATMYTDLDQFKVVLEVDPADQQDPAALGRIHLPGAGSVPLAAVTRTRQDLAPISLSHQGQLPAITIGFNLKAGVAIGDAMGAIERMVASQHLPPEISAGFAGDAREARDSNSDMPLLLLGAVVAMYLVLGMLYESYAHPLTILSTIPSAGLGALLALLATGLAFSMVAMIGVVLLIGIVKKNAILMVDFALVAERELGLTPRAAILRAARLRLRPITMTTVAAVFGALPIAIGLGVGAELRQPLGVAMIGGLVVSQAVTLYTTPVVYLAIDRLRRRRRRSESRWLPVELPAE